MKVVVDFHFNSFKEEPLRQHPVLWQEFLTTDHAQVNIFFFCLDPCPVIKQSIK